MSGMAPGADAWHRMARLALAELDHSRFLAGMAVECQNEWMAKAEAARDEVERLRDLTRTCRVCQCGRTWYPVEDEEPCPHCEVERLQTWAGLMEALDRLYPPDVVDGSSGDPGPRIVVLCREVERLQAQAQADAYTDAESGETIARLQARLAEFAVASVEATPDDGRPYPGAPAAWGPGDEVYDGGER